MTIDWTVKESVRAKLRVDREAHPPEVRLPAGQAGEGDADGAGAGRAAVQGLGGLVRLQSVNDSEGRMEQQVLENMSKAIALAERCKPIAHLYPEGRCADRDR